MADLLQNWNLFRVDIRCLQTTSRELFAAVIATPNSLSSAPPVFEDRPSIDPSTSTTCQISQSDRSGRYRMSLSNLDYCGVTTCPQDGQVRRRSFTLPFKLCAVLEAEIVIHLCCVVALALSDAALPGSGRPQTARR